MHNDFSSKISKIVKKTYTIRTIPCKECVTVNIVFIAQIFLNVSKPLDFSSLFKHIIQAISINLSLG